MEWTGETMATIANFKKTFRVYISSLQELWRFFAVICSQSSEQKSITYLLYAAAEQKLDTSPPNLVVLGHSGPAELAQLKEDDFLVGRTTIAVCDRKHSNRALTDDLCIELIRLYTNALRESPTLTTVAISYFVLKFNSCTVYHYFGTPVELRLGGNEAWLVLIWEDYDCRWHYNQNWVKRCLGKGSLVLNYLDPPLLSASERLRCEETQTPLRGEIGCYLLTTTLYGASGLEAIPLEHAGLTAVKKV